MHTDPARASDAAPEGALPELEPEPASRRPGEALFAAAFLALSLVLLWQAYGISGFTALSGPGAVPMATAAVMALTAALVLARTLRLPRAPGQRVRRDVLPGAVLLIVAMLGLYAALLVPFGFLPTSALFLVAAVKLLGRRGWGHALIVSLGSLALIYLVFRIVFTVLMPAGIVPEGEMIQWVRDLVRGAS